MINFRHILWLGIFLTLPFSFLAQIQTDANVTNQQMIDAITGSGVIPSSVTINCNKGSYGTFNGTATNLGLNQGIILSTGLASPFDDSGCIYSVNAVDDSGDGWTCGEIQVFIDGNLEATIVPSAVNSDVFKYYTVPVGSTFEVTYSTTGGAGCDETEHSIYIAGPDGNEIVSIGQFGTSQAPIPAGSLLNVTANCNPSNQEQMPGYSIEGPNDDNIASFNASNGFIDPDLTQLSSEAKNDVCIMEFDIIPSCDTLQINYVFASEEYPEFVCSDYNDIFGFFVSGPGINGPFTNNAENIAIVPGSNPQQYVGINTVNSGQPGISGTTDGCTPQGLSNSQYYVDNGDGFNCPGAPHCTDNSYIRYNGMTTPLLAKTAVQACETYHVKLIIADALDFSYDSGVFIEFEGLSCSSPFAALTVSRDTIIEGCAETELTVSRAGDGSTAETYNLTILGDATNGTDYSGIPTQVDFQVGELSQTFNVTPISDANTEGFELIRVAVEVDVCGFLTQDTVDIHIGDKPTLTLNPTNPTCNEANGTIEANLSSEISPVNYTWSANANGQTTQTINNLAPGNFTVDIVDGAGCNYSDNSNLINVGDLLVTENLTHNTCAGDCLGENQLTIANEIGNVNIAWTDENNNTIGTNNNANINNLCAGNYSVSVSDDVCTIVQNFTINQPDSVQLTIPNDTLICLDGTASLNVTGTNGIEPYAYNWGDNINTNPRNFSPSTDTTIQIFITDNNGCNSQTKSIQVNVRDSIKLTNNSPLEICNGSSTQINVNATGGSGVYTYNWNNGLGDNNSHNVSPSTQTIYTVSVSDDCETPTELASIIVNVNYPVVPSITANPKEGCEPLEVSFTNGNIPQGGQCEWLFGDGASSNQCGQVTHTYNESGIYDVTIKTVSNQGCDTTIVLSNYITVYENPKADFSYSPYDVNALKPDVDFTNLSTNNSSNEWKFEGTTFSTEEHPSRSFPLYQPDTHNICLYVANDFGCADSICKDVIIHDILTVFAPNTFTPDGDEFNQTWRVYVNGIDPTGFNLNIYNRWGELIWHSNNIEDAWDGKYKGRMVQDGTYVWTLWVKDVPTDKKFEYRGIVNVLR